MRDKKHHVLLLHQFFCTPGSPHGTRHYEFAELLSRHGTHFTVLASAEFVVRSQADDMETRHWLTILRLPSVTLGNGGYFWRVYAFIRFTLTAIVYGMSVRGVDVVMGTTPSLFQAFASWVIAVFQRKPFVLEVRDLWPAFAVDIGLLRNPLIIAIAERAEMFLYRRATRIIVNSPAYIDYLVAKGISRTTITLVPNGSSSQNFARRAVRSPAAEAYRKRWSADNRFVVVYAGAIRMANHLDSLIEAASHLLRLKSDTLIVIVGDGRERCRLESETQQRELGNILFTGNYPKKDIPDVLSAADACYASLCPIPMFKMTYPNKVFDYMASGKPTILAIDGVIRKVIEECEGGIYTAVDDPVAIAHAIDQLSRSPADAAAMGQRARVHLEKHFDRGQHAGVLLNVLFPGIAKGSDSVVESARHAA